MSEWREVVGRPPPKHLSRPLMVQILSHTYQMDMVGGYTKRLDSRLKSAVQPPIFAHSFLVSLIGFLGRVGACLMRDEV